MEQNNFVICADNNVTYSMGILMYSILKNTKGTCIFHIFFNGELNSKDEERLQLLSQSFSCQIIIYWIDNSDIRELHGTNEITATAFYRLIAPYILYEEGVDTCLYLDTDILCVRDVSPLFFLDFKDKVAYVVQSSTSYPEEMKQYCKSIGMHDNKFFNSGVLLINTKLYSVNDIGKKAIQLKLNKADTRYVDQGVLNIALEGNVLYDLNSNNNCTMSVQNFEFHQNKVRFIHFTGTKKPWKLYTACWGAGYTEKGRYSWKFQYYKAWRDYRDASPWKDIPFEIPKNATEWRYLAKMYYLPQKQYIKGIQAYIKYLQCKYMSLQE